MNKQLKVVLLIFLFAFVWFYRETTFIYTNALISEIEYQTNNHFKMFLGLGFLKNCDLQTLYILKWLFTFIYAIVFWLLCLLLVKWFYTSAVNYKLTHFVYLALFALSFAAYSLGYLISELQDYAYSFSRYLLGAAQSPLVAMLLIPVFMAKKSYSY